MLNILIDGLAAKRLTRLVHEDEITRTLREHIHTHNPPLPRLSYLIECPICLSVYSSFLVSVCAITFPKASKVLRYALALAELQALYTEYEARRSASHHDFGEPLLPGDR